MRRTRRHSLISSIIIFIASACIARAAGLPDSLSDEEFWSLVTRFSEPGGVFQPQLMTNEDSLQFVIPALKEKIARGGVYIGVGTEQNFTYIAATQPRIAFVLDIRRDNMLELLMYKAVFEISTDRGDFLSRLFSRKRPAGLDANSTVTALFDAYRSAEADAAMYDETLRAVLDQLVTKHKFQLSAQDTARISTFMNAFRNAGPNNLRGSGDKGLSYAQSMTGTDQAGTNQSYLATEANFKFVQEFEKRNLLVPLVGDFAGDKAIAGIGSYVREHGAVIDVFYVSNVERYLWEQGDHGKQFYVNAAGLPTGPSSTFIRSVTTDISRRLGIRIPEGPENWRSFLVPIDDFLKRLAVGGVQGYRDLFE